MSTAQDQQQPSTEVAKRSPVQDLVARVRSGQFLEQIALALPGNVRPERFQRAVVTAIMQTPEVVVDPDTLFQSAIRAAQDGLIPDGREAAFVVVKEKGVKKVAYWPMIGGYRKIAAKHGITLVADVVRAGDYFDWSKMPPKVEHRPAIGGDRGDIVCVYAAAFDRDWRFVTAPTVMDVDEVNKVRDVSKAKDSEYGPWRNWWDRMAVKTVARRLFNELPLGDLDELEERIVRRAEADADLPDTSGLNVAEANIAASLTTRPPGDKGPDDRAVDRPLTGDAAGAEKPPADRDDEEEVGEVVDEHDGEPVQAGAPTADQHKELLSLLSALTEHDGDVDWQAHVDTFAGETFDRAEGEQLSGPQMEQLLAHLRAQLPPKQTRRRS